MSNLWDNLADEERRAIIEAMLVGSPRTHENFNRAAEMLAQNPGLVERFAAEAGIEGGEAADPELTDAHPDAQSTPVEEGNEIERNVTASLAEDENVQETGEVSSQSDLPPPEKGESFTQYMSRVRGNVSPGKPTQMAERAIPRQPVDPQMVRRMR